MMDRLKQPTPQPLGTRPPFLLDAFGPYGQEQLRLIWTNQPKPRHPQLDQLIESTWQIRTEQAQREGVLLFNGQLVRLVGWETRGRELILETGPTDYAHFLATNYHHPHLGEQIGWDLFSNPIGTTANIITSDGWLAYGRRSEAVACHPGFVHAIGGGLEAGELRPDGTFDAFASIFRELQEELDLSRELIESALCLGLIRDPEIKQPELIFDVFTSISRQDLSKRFNASERHEHNGLVFCRNEPSCFNPFIRETSRIAPITIGALCLHGRQVEGDSWFDATLNMLSSDGLQIAT